MEARDIILALLARRAPEATICPSEVARILATVAHADASAIEWRDTMPTVHVAVDRLVDEGLVRLSWKGRRLVRRAGAYRIERGVSR